MDQRLENLKSKIICYPDFPKPGIQFQDIFSLLNDAEAFKELKELLVLYLNSNISPSVEVIVGLESRGFLIGSVLALELNVPFVPIRKPGKLPGDLVSVSYTLEYGTDTFEMQRSSIKAGQKVLIVDDLLATGGSMSGAMKLIEEVGGEVLGCLVVMELMELKGRQKLNNCPVHSLLKF